MHCIICEDELLLRRIDIAKLVVAFVWRCEVSQLPKDGIYEDDWYHMHCVVVESHCITLTDFDRRCAWLYEISGVLVNGDDCAFVC